MIFAIIMLDKKSNALFFMQYFTNSEMSFNNNCNESKISGKIDYFSLNSQR